MFSVNAVFLAEATVVDANGFVETDSNGNGTLYHIFSVEAQSVPEPPTVALLGVAILLI